MVWMRVEHRRNEGHGWLPFLDFTRNQDRQLRPAPHQKVGRSQIGEIQEPGTIRLPAQSANRVDRFLATATTPSRPIIRTDLPSSLPVTLSPGIIFATGRAQDPDRYLFCKDPLEQAPGTQGFIIRVRGNDQDLI